MQLTTIPSPFTPNTHIVVLMPRTGTDNLILCNPEIEGGLPIEWVEPKGAEHMIACIQAEGFGEYQFLYEGTCAHRTN